MTKLPSSVVSIYIHIYIDSVQPEYIILVALRLVLKIIPVGYDLRQ
jgi:hypothetical protein